MSNPSPNFTRLQYLSDTLRRQFPGFTDENADSNHNALADISGRGGQRRLEEAIRKTLTKSIPEHPAYNAQVLFALKTFRANNVASLDPKNNANDAARIGEIVTAVHNKRPKFKQLTEDAEGYSHFGPLREDTLRLHTLLKGYSSIRGGDLHTFPSIETLGHRGDEMRLKKFDPGPAPERKRGRLNLRSAWDDLKDQRVDARGLAGEHLDVNTDALADTFVPPDIWVDAPVGWTDKMALRKQQLKEIHKHLNTRCPEGSYFNRTRQEIIHQVWSNRHSIDAYKEGIEHGRKMDWVRSDGSVWVQPEIQSKFNHVLDETRRVLAAASRNLTATYPDLRQIAPQDAVTIDQLMRNHQRMGLKSATERLPPGAPRSGNGTVSLDTLPRDYVPEEIKRAVTYRENMIRASPIAQQWAKRCEETTTQLIPYEGRETLTKRIALQKTVFANRDYFIGEGTDNRFSSRHSQFQQHYLRLLKTKPDLLNQLARELDSFDQAWTGKLRTPPERHAPEPAVQPVGKLRKPATAFQTKELTSAAAEPGQQKLPFKHARSQGAIEQGAVDDDTAMNGTEPAAGTDATQSRKRKREDGQTASMTSPIASAGTAGSGDEQRAKRSRPDRASERERSQVR